MSLARRRVGLRSRDRERCDLGCNSALSKGAAKLRMTRPHQSKHVFTNRNGRRFS